MRTNGDGMAVHPAKRPFSPSITNKHDFAKQTFRNVLAAILKAL
jgi:hypothetical protein